MKRITAKWKAMIENNPMAFGTLDKRGNPNVIAVSCVKAVGDDKLLITDNFMHTTKKNLHEHPKVSLCVWDKDWHGCKINGTATYYDKGPWLQKVKRLPENEGYPAKGAIVVRITSLQKLA